MAERNHLRIADHNDVPNDDPFAELTRIMGFDPRRPVRSEQAAQVEPAVETDDFGIDLEKELMGEFAAEQVEAADPGEDPLPHHQAEASTVQATAEPELDAAVMASFEEEFLVAAEDAFVMAEEPAMAAEAAQSPLEPIHGDDSGNAFDEQDFSLSLEQELAAQDEFHAAPEPADVTPEAVSAPVDPMEASVAAAFEQEFVVEDGLPSMPDAGDGFLRAAEAGNIPLSSPNAVAGPDPFTPADSAPFTEAENDDAHSLDDASPAVAYAENDADYAEESAAISDNAFDDEPSMEQELTLADDWPAQVEPVAATDEAPAYQPAEPVAEAGDETAYAAEFDAALADIDMDFRSPAIQTDESAAPAADADLDAELAFRLEEAAADDVAPMAEAAQPVIAEDAVDPLDDFSLEDELNALLGNTPARAPAPVAVEAVRADEAVAEIEAVNWDFAEDQAAGDRPEADFGQTSIQEPVSAAPVEAFEEAPMDALEEDMAAALAAENAAEQSSESDFDLDFDDAAFEAAMSNSIAGQDTVSHATEQVGVSRALPEQEQPVVKPEKDPYAAFTALTASFRPAAPAEADTGEASPSEATFQAYDDEPAHAVYEDEQADGDYVASNAYDDTPDIDTIDVPEHAVALADDLDIPDFNFDEAAPSAPAYDDIDAEFASLLNAMNSPEPAQPAQAPAYEPEEYEAEFDRQSGSGHVSDHAYAAAAGVAAGAAHAGAMRSPSATAIGADGGAAPTAVQADEFEVAQFDFDPELDEEMAAPVYGAIEDRQRPQRRGMMIAAIVGGVAVLGGIGAFAMASGGGDSTGAPAVIKADADPVKVKPKNPGGTTIPNQDSKVYNTVAGTGAGSEPKQEKLLTSVEEPVELPAPPAPAVDNAPAASEPAPANQLAGSPPAPAGELPGVATVGKSEDRIEQVLEDAAPDGSFEVAAVAPRKVRTMIVKPDGTLVAREDPTPAVAETPAATASESVKDPAVSAPESTGTVPSAAGATFAAPAGGEATTPEAAAAPATVQASSTPSSVPIAPARPSDQPVDIVGEVNGDQVASISPAATAAAGAWSMQIASQPSEAAAQSSYQDLVGRYGSVLEGRPANIVKAEIAGKGTFWRVRVPAGSRNDAISLCESYKSAGGNCFVSK